MAIWIFVVGVSSGVGAQAHGVDQEVARALQAYAPLLAQQPAGDLTRAGFAHLLAGKTDEALAAFQQALSRQEAYAPAHYGMALASYMAGRAEGTPAAYVQQTRYHAERAVGLYPNFADPYRLLGQIHLEILEDYNLAVDAFVRSLEVDPTTDPDVIRKTAIAYLRTGALQEMDKGITDSLLALDGATALLPIVAQACLDRKSPELAMQYFGRYFAHLAPAERLLYQDISLIASKEDRQAYQQTEGDAAARREFLARFWAVRDPDLMTGVNERQIEHYRRVWFARTNFARHAYPWDRRGEVYIRYGPPDYRSRSGMPAPLMNAAVERIKERLAIALYGEEGVGEVSAGPTFPILIQGNPGMDFPDLSQAALEGGSVAPSDEASADPVLSQEPLSPDEQAVLAGQTSEDVTLNSRYGQVGNGQDVSFVRWESWVYTGVAGGIEVVFTDQWSGGKFDYAPVPPPDPAKTDAVKQTSRLVTYSPRVVMARSIAQMPEYYMPGGRETFQDFYYDCASFRGRDGKTRVEVYFGLPPKNLATMVRGDTSFAYVGCATAILDPGSGQMWQAHDDGLFRTAGNLSGVRGDFIPNQLDLEVTPGTYELRVQVKDLISGKSGIYKEHLDVADYSGAGLAMSDLQMSWKASTEGGMEKYRKGDVWVLPMTTKAYRKGQNPFVYYEVYNLAPDKFGQSRFRLDYTIQSEPEKGGGFGRLMAGVGRVFHKKGAPQVSVSAEQVRSETDLKEFLELNLARVKGGVNRLTVTVTDLNSGASAQKDVLFRFE